MKIPFSTTATIIVTGLACSILPAAAQESPIQGDPAFREPAAYRCGDLVAQVELRLGEMRLGMDGRTYVLQRLHAASGTRYQTGQGANRIRFWEKGDQATLEVADRRYPECERIAPPRQAATLPYEARGNEPGWRLGITRRTIVLDWAYGERQASWPRPEPTIVPGGYRYAARSESHEMEAVVQAELCKDSMTGMPYPDTVYVTIDGERLSGCGGSPANILQNVEWRVERVSRMEVPPGSRITLTFGGDNRLAGEALCNLFSGEYALGAEGLTIGPIATTRRTCDPPLEGDDSLFIALLRDVAGFDLSQDRVLELRTNDGRVIVARPRPGPDSDVPRGYTLDPQGERPATLR